MQNPRRVSEVIYSSKLIPRVIYTLFLRSTHDPINSPNADPRSTHDLRQSATDALKSTDDPTTNLALIPLVVRSGRGTQQPLLRNPPTWRRLDAAGETTNTTGTSTNREKQSTHKFNEVRQCAYVLGAREREILLIQQTIQLIQKGKLRNS